MLNQQRGQKHRICINVKKKIQKFMCKFFFYIEDEARVSAAAAVSPATVFLTFLGP